MTDPTPPVANADLVNTLQVVIDDIEKNRKQVVQHGVDLDLQKAQNADTIARFDVLLHGLKLLAADPFAVQQVAERLAADEAAKNAPDHSTLVLSDAPPLAPAVSTGADPEGSAEVSAAAPATDGFVGTDANGSPVAGDTAAAS